MLSDHVCNILSNGFNIKVKLSAEMVIFRVLINERLLVTDMKNAFASHIALRKALEWKSPNASKVSLWLSNLMFFLKLDKNKVLHQRNNWKVVEVTGPLHFVFRYSLISYNIKYPLNLKK